MGEGRREKREEGTTNIPSIIRLSGPRIPHLSRDGLLVISSGVLFPKEGLARGAHCSVDRLHRVSPRLSVPDPRSKDVNSKGWSRILQVEKLLERYCTRTISLWRVVWESVATNENNESGIDIGREERAAMRWTSR